MICDVIIALALIFVLICVCLIIKIVRLSEGLPEPELEVEK
jgi:hypothetical protein